MTLILALGNADQVIQISDRRHTVDRRVVDDERNKATIMACRNARFAVGFTGIAQVGSFDTQEWILTSLHECGPPEYTAGKMVERLCDKATKDFRSHPALRGRKDKWLTILFSGYLDHFAPPLCVYAYVTNYQDFDTLTDSAECWNEFRTYYYNEKRPDEIALEDLSMVQRIGAWHAWQPTDECALRPMLMQRRPADAIARKGYTVVHDMARRRRARNLIGSQLTCITIPRNRRKAFGFHYDTRRPVHQVPGPDFAIVVPGGDMLLKDVVFENAPRARPAAVPRVRPDQICPCGSRKRYKFCHGLRQRWVD